MDIANMVTERIIEKLEAGIIPWKKTWSGGNSPANLTTGKPYKGINRFLLGCQGFESKYWLTFNQARTLGASVKKGEKASIIVFYSPIDKPKAKDTPKGEKPGKKAARSFILRYFNVFNAEQIDGLENHPLIIAEKNAKNPNPNPEKRIDACDNIVEGYVNRPHIEHRDTDHPCYVPALDVVQMPFSGAFESMEDYYGTLFHELIHSTGHESRLNRTGKTWARFGSASYAAEELVAEMGASILATMVGMDNQLVDNSAAYIASWLKVLKAPENRTMLIKAASAAQKAVDYICEDECTEDEE